jgi:hypothetical protein
MADNGHGARLGPHSNPDKPEITNYKHHLILKLHLKQSFSYNMLPEKPDKGLKRPDWN